MADNERMTESDAFGYRNDDRILGEAITVQVAEAKEPNTLQPKVLAYFRFEPDGKQIGIALHPRLADELAAELTRWAARARERHWE